MRTGAIFIDAGYLFSAGSDLTQRQRQSELLVRESDHHVVLDSSTLAAHLRLAAPPVAPQAEPDRTEEAGTSGPTPVVGLMDGDTDATLHTLAEGIVSDTRFPAAADVLSPHDPTRPDRRADRVLVARLAELTGMFPVEKQLLERARRICVEMAVQRAGN